MGSTCESVRVDTLSGPISGEKLPAGERKANAFKGIPYAKPPVGSLRFKKPEPVEPWTEVKDCTNFGNQSIQKLSSKKPNAPPISEDCLTLNVFSPDWEPTDPEGFPVYFFVHGGGFATESTFKYGDKGICENLVSKGVVVVTIEYRVGLLGFFTTGDEHCPGNNALWDCKLALEWTRDNLSRFRGNKDRITVSGQSAGSAMTQLLAISPHTRDLFHQMLCMAGFTNRFCNWFHTSNGIEKCRTFGESVGIEGDEDSEEFLEKLRTIPAEKFALGIELDQATQQLYIAPRFDGDFFPRPFHELLHEAPAKNIIMGCAHSESIMGTDQPFSISVLLSKIAQSFPENVFHTQTKAKRREFIKMLMDNHKSMDKIVEMIVEVDSGNFMTSGLQRAVLDWLKKSPNVFMYSFEYYNPDMYAALGLPFKASTHCAELPYIFDIRIFGNFTFDETDKAVLSTMTDRVTNFVKFGNPNGEHGCTDEVEWQPASADHPQRHLVILENSRMADVYKGGCPLYIVQETEKCSH
ncbi:unnamed protein product [Auanema sp. JU1783]|nr:unnamed protein product [Auanema sp. JU1783]